MFTSFILVHQDGEPIMLNILDISYVTSCDIFLRSDPDKCISVDESFDVINDKLCKELNGEL